MSKKYSEWRNYGGVNTAVDEREGENFLASGTQNFDSNMIEGALVSRKGYASRLDTVVTDLENFFVYRDEEWNKDVLLAYDKDSTEANRRLWLYTKTLGAAGNFTKIAEYSYGSLRFGDRISFLLHRNGVRIGTGTGTTNKALFAGYIDRSIASGRAMFNDAIEFADFFVTKQQWVQQPSLVNHGKIVYDSTREKYYVLSTAGLEIRDSDFYIERVLNDVVTERVAAGAAHYYSGGLALTGNSLYVIGQAPGGDYELILYDLSDNFVIDASSALTGKTGYSVATNGTLVWITTHDGADGLVEEYSMDLSSSATRYTGAGDTLQGITYDSTYVYVCDKTNGDIVRMLIAAPYTTATFATGVTPIDIAHYNGNLYFTTTTIVYETATSTFNAKTAKYTDTNQTNEFISFVSAIPYLSQRSGRIVYFDGVTNFNEAGYIPTKLAIGSTNSTSTSDTFFYALSVVDIYGQESHLMRGCAVHGNSPAPNVNLVISVNVDSENFAEMTSPSTDPDQAVSVWNEFRRIQKIRVYRAYNEASQASEPTTDYLFLREIDINDVNWSEVTANSLYTLTFYDGVSQSDISSVTYEESSGLPADLKPYYTNWQYATEFAGRFYYGNMRTDDLYLQQIIESEPNAPDTIYQHDENITLFFPRDGDEIKGFAESWNRLIVFKGLICGIFDGLNLEKIYEVGLQSPDSIVTWNNQVFFLFNNGFYQLTPSGFNRISLPVRTILESESAADLAAIAGTFFDQKEKVWWVAPGSRSYLYNVKKDAWDIYDLNHSPTIEIEFITKGIDGLIFTGSAGGQVYEQNTTTQDAGTDIAVTLVTHKKEVGDGYLDAIFHRFFMTHKYTGAGGDATASFQYQNGTGDYSITSISLDQHTTLKSDFQFLNGAWGQIASVTVAGNIDAELQVNALGVEYSIHEYARISIV